MKSNPVTNQEQPCWFASNRKFNLSERSYFIVDSMTGKPRHNQDRKTATKVDGDIGKKVKSRKAKLTALDVLFRSL